MTGSDYTGGPGVIIWAVIGLLVGLLFGWYFGDYVSYAVVGVVFGWLGGLMLAGHDDGGDAHH